MRSLLAVAGAIFALSHVFASAAPDVLPESRAAFDKAEVAKEEGRVAAAAVLYRQALEKSPLYYKAHAAYLDALRARGSFGDAQAFYQGLIDKVSGNTQNLKILQASAQDAAAALKALLALAEEETELGGNLRYRTELGRAYLNSGAFKKAEKELEAALKIKEDAIPSRLLIGDSFLLRGKVSSARKHYESVLELDATHVPATMRIALCWQHAKKPDKAITQLEKLVAEENLPRLVAAHWMLLVLYHEKGDPKKCLKRVELILSIAKSDVDAMIAKGQLLLELKRPVDAAKVFELAVKNDEAAWLPVFCLGWAHEVSADAPEIDDAKRTERLVAAAEAYGTAARMSPGVRPRDSLGFIQLRLGEHREAVTQFKRAIDIDPSFATAANNLGLADDIAENTSQAVKRYEAILAKLEKKNVRAIVMLGLDYWLQGSASKAIKKFKEALKINPDDDLAWTFLGDVHYDNKKVKDAIRAYKEAVEIRDKNFIAWYHLGIAYDDLNKIEDAEEAYRKAVDAKPDPPADLWVRLGWVYDEQKKYEDALKAFKEYIQLVGEDENVQERIQELEEMLADN